VVLAEIPKGVRVCNRYVFGGLAGLQEPGQSLNLASGLAASDAMDVLSRIDGYRFGDLRVKHVSARLDLRRGTRQAFMRSARAAGRARAGRMLKVKLDVVHVGGRKETLTQTVKLPRRLRRGLHELTLTGTDSDDGAGDIFGAITTLIIGDQPEDSGGDPGHSSIKQLARSIRRVERWDGVNMRFDGARRASRGFRRDDVRLSGRVSVLLRVR
jgi:hypothetical protein